MTFHYVRLQHPNWCEKKIHWAEATHRFSSFPWKMCCCFRSVHLLRWRGHSSIGSWKIDKKPVCYDWCNACAFLMYTKKPCGEWLFKKKLVRFEKLVRLDKSSDDLFNDLLPVNGFQIKCLSISTRKSSCRLTWTSRTGITTEILTTSEILSSTAIKNCQVVRTELQIENINFAICWILAVKRIIVNRN